VKEISTDVLTTGSPDTSKQAFEAAMTLAEKFGVRIIVAHIEDDH
jgi:hypothetical protein